MEWSVNCINQDGTEEMNWLFNKFAAIADLQ